MSSDERFRQSFAEEGERDYVVQPKNGIVMASLSTRTTSGKADEQRFVDDCERDAVRDLTNPMLLASKIASGLNM